MSLTNRSHDQSEVTSADMPANSGLNPEAGIRAFEDIRTWAREVEDYGWPHFDEFSQRLEAARPAILGSIGLPNDYLRQLTEQPSQARPVPAAPLRNSAERQQVTELVDHYEQLIRHLQGSHLCFVSWQAACREFEAVREHYETVTGQLYSGSKL